MRHVYACKGSGARKSSGNAITVGLGLTLALTLQAGAAAAQTAPRASDRLAACDSIQNDSARLACYDAVRRNGGSSPVPAPNYYPPLHPSAAHPPARSQPEGFGAPSTTARTPTPPSPRHLAARVVNYSFSKAHRFTIELDNGQVWRQYEGDAGSAHFKARGQNNVVITKEFWNSYNLRLNDMNAVFRVQRMK